MVQEARLAHTLLTFPPTSIFFSFLGFIYSSQPYVKLAGLSA